MIPRSHVEQELSKLQKADIAEPLKYTEVEVEDYTFTFVNGGVYTVTVFPDDSVRQAGTADERYYYILKPIESTTVFTKHLMMVTRQNRLQKIYEKPFKPSQDGACPPAEIAHPISTP